VVKMLGLVNTCGCVIKTRTVATPMAIATAKRTVTMRRTGRLLGVQVCGHTHVRTPRGVNLWVSGHGVLSPFKAKVVGAVLVAKGCCAYSACSASRQARCSRDSASRCAM
jgi:hypothetical protein